MSMPSSDTDPGPFEQIFFELAFLRSASAAQMREAKEMAHNRDLVPLVHRLADDLLAVIRRYRDVSYDIQGLRDRGVDVLVTMDSDIARRVGVQVKSHSEVRENGIVATLQRQYAEAANAYDVQSLDYYIMLFADAEDQKVVDRARDIAAAFSTTRNTYVIGPRNACALLDLSRYQIDAVVKANLWDGDPVVRSAIEETVGWTITETRVALQLVVECLFEGSCSIELLCRLGMELPEVEAFVDDMDWIRMEVGVATASHVGFPAIASVLLDAKVRFEYTTAELNSFAEDLFLVSRRQLVDMDDRLSDVIEESERSGQPLGQVLQRTLVLSSGDVNDIADRVGYGDFNRNVEASWQDLATRILDVTQPEGWFEGLPPID